MYSGVSANWDATGWVLSGTAHHVLDGDRAQKLAVVTDGGVFLVDAAKAVVHRSPIFDPVLHVAEVCSMTCTISDDDRVYADTEKAHHQALTGLADHHGWCLPAGAGSRPRACEAAPAVRPWRSGRSKRCSTRPSTCTWPSKEPVALATWLTR